MLNVVTLSAHGYEAAICPQRGANLIRLARPDLGLDALRTPAGLADFTEGNPYLWGTPILFPPNRISGARFTFEGRVYRWPLNEPATGCFLHGSIHETPFTVVEEAADRAVLRYRATAEAPYLTFPHAFTMTVTYTLDKGGLCQAVGIRNDSPLTMPVALGFHTTFRIPFTRGGRPEDVRLALSCGREIPRNMADYLPTGELVTDFAWREDYRRGAMAPCAHNISRHYEMAEPRRMALTDAATGARVVYEADESYRYWMVYNGGSRDFLCVEPQTWMNNCPNAPFPREETGFDCLAPGAEKTYRTWIRLEREACP